MPEPKRPDAAGMIPLELLSKQAVMRHVIKEIDGPEGIAREIVSLLRESDATPATRWAILQNITRTMEEVSESREEGMTAEQARTEILALVKEALESNISPSAMAEVRAALAAVLDETSGE